MQKKMLGEPVDWSDPINRGLVLLLRMNEGHGDVVRDLSLNGNHGKLHGMAHPGTKTSGWTAGFRGKTLAFDGTDDIIRIPDSESLSPTSAITVMVWVKGAAGSDKGIIGHSDLNQRAFLAYISAISPYNRVRVVIKDSGIGAGHTKSYLLNTPLLDTTWHLFGFTFDSGTLKIFMDGIEDTDITKTNDDAITTIHNSTADVILGCYLSSGTPRGFFNGDIDEARVYKRALSQSEWLRLAMEGSPQITPKGRSYPASFYGVAWDENADTYVRTGSLTGMATGASAGNDDLPIQRQMRRCVMNDAGVVQYYLDADDSTKKENGDASDLTGGDGQVMVEIPAFYQRYGYDGTTHTWDISKYDLAGFSLHPAFTKNGSIVPHRYIGAYEGSMWDATTSAMVPPANIIDDMYASGDKLCSYSGEFPKTNEMRSEFRTMAAQRGTGWRQLDFDLNSAIQLLYLTEYADFNSQSMIGMGRTELSGGSWTAGSYIGQCGKSNGDGDGTNSVAGNTNNAYMTYRGIENWYGNVWKFNDGINVNANVPYVSNNDSVWADGTSTGYDALGITLANANGYQVTLEQTDRGFLPASVGGSSSTYVCDYYYQNPGWRVVLLGGHAYDGANAGAFYMAANYAASYNYVAIGGRLSF